MEHDPSREQTDPNSESEDELDHLFPTITAKEFRHSLETLRANYSKDLHSRQLLNYCFRCHEPTITAAYAQFKDEYHPDIKEPSISAFFSNDSFLEPKQVGNSLAQQSEYPRLHIGPVPKSLGSILDGIFQAHGCIPNLERFLLFYPSYLEKHILLQRKLFEGDKIDRELAFFLAFCGAAEMSCVYMMVRYYNHFKAAGGDLRWISEAKYPSKYRAILELNRILAKAVWEISEDFMIELCENSGFPWSKSEIAIILEILAFSHQNSTIALALGLNCEDPIEKLDLLNIQGVEQAINEYRSRVYAPSESKERLAVLISHLKEENDNPSETSVESLTSLRKAVKRSEGEEEVEAYMKDIGQELSKQELNNSISQHLKTLLEGHKVIEKRRENKYPTIDYSEFNFTFMAYPQLNNLTHNVADKALNLISYSETMSKENFGSQKVNTKEFRRTMRYYAENLCGYRHHEYDYKTNVSLHLTLALKFFIRLLTLSPVHMHQHVIREIHHESGQLECFDIGHVALIIANTKMSLELTLAMRALEFE